MLLTPTPSPSGRRARRRRKNGGQVLPLLALMIVVAGLAMATVARFGVVVVDRARASAGADAAALAGAADGEVAARRLAVRNGGTLVGYQEVGTDVRVHVRVGRSSAWARASLSGGGIGSGASGAIGGLAPAMRAALARAEQLLGQAVPVVSGYRSASDQAQLWARRAENPFPVAPPGTSMHERGLAIDVPRSFVARLVAVAREAGLCQPYPAADPVHFEVCPADGSRL